ncbi:HlyD family secretion protein [Stenotrophomonas sp. NRRL B-14846]|uniref:HlyD family secretion protein n=1 Tax=Stenotrophomonas sp. NRRL B-14846 TaxID=3162882 RepID=UPI003D2DF5F7
MIEKLGQVLPRGGLSTFVLAWATVAVAVTALAILLHGRYARTEEVRGHIALGNITRIGIERPGVLDQLLVQVGDPVVAGQPIAHVTIPEQDSITERGQSVGALGLQTLKSVQTGVQQEALQAREIHQLRLRSIQQQLQQVEQELRAIAAAVEAIDARMQLAESAHQRYEKLAEQRYVTQLELEDAIARKQQLRAEHANMQASLLAGRQRQTQLQLDRKRAEEDLTSRLNALSLQQADVQDRIHAQQRERGYTVFAPTAGVVDMLAHAAGDNLTTGQPLALIRTGQEAGPHLARLRLPQRTAGLIREGDTVNVRIDAFPYERYGLVPGKVLRLTSGTLAIPGLPDQQDASTFLADVALDLDAPIVRIRREWLKDGMDLQGSVRLQDVNLLEWLFLPVIRGWTRNSGDVLLPAEQP